MNLTFVYAPEFMRQADGIFTDDDLRQVEMLLLANPRAGVVVPGTGGVRKLRVALPGRGKSGSARFIYFYAAPRSRIYFLTLYLKSQRATLSAAGKQQMRAITEMLGRERP